jgi:hypothetical protein
MSQVPPGRYQRNDGTPELKLSAVLFLDVLGTSAAASKDNAQETLERLDRALANARARSQVDDPNCMADASWFSDNLALACSLEGETDYVEIKLGEILIAAAWIQFSLATEGLFTRGGLVCGSQFSDAQVNFGPALVEAVALERVTDMPRVAISDDVMKIIDALSRRYAHGGGNPFESEVMIADDDVPFINYLAACLEPDDVEESVTMLQRHRETIESALVEHREEPKISRKLAWLRQYHNAFCGQFFPGQEELLCDEIDGGGIFSTYAGPPHDGHEDPLRRATWE